jgi:hypothetical protein
MLDIGSGYSHVGEVILRDAPGRSCVLMEPAYNASPRVTRRTARYGCWPLRGDGRHLPLPMSGSISSQPVRRITIAALMIGEANCQPGTSRSPTKSPSRGFIRR